MQTHITLKCVIEKETKKLGEKPLWGPPSWNDLLVNKIRVQGYQKDLLSLIYPLFLNPPSSNSQRTSLSLFFTSYLDPVISFMRPSNEAVGLGLTWAHNLFV